MTRDEYRKKYSGVKFAGDTAILDICGHIGIVGFDWATWEITCDNRQEAVIAKIKALSSLEKDPVKKLTLNINSLGGYTEHAIAIYDFCASIGLELETRCFGQAASAATLLAQLGKVRKVSANIRYLVHRCWASGIIGNKYELQQSAADLENTDKRMIGLYATRSGRSEAEITELLDRNGGNGVWLTAQETVAAGLADVVVPATESVALASAAALAEFSLPALPEDPVLSTRNEAESSQTQQEVNMDAETMKKAQGLFGAEFTLNAMQEGKDFGAMAEAYAAASNARIAALESENKELKAAAEAAAADKAKAEAAAAVPAPGAPAVPPSVPAESEANADKKQKPSFGSIVGKAWNKNKKEGK